MAPVSFDSIISSPKIIYFLLPVFLICYFFARLCQERIHFRKLARQGLPMPPHSAVFGHLHICARIFRNLPHDAHSYYLANEMRRLYPDLGPAFYLDIWPFGCPVFMVADKDLIRQFTRDGGLPKHEGILHFLQPLTGGRDLVTMEGQQWKEWRQTFNPVFSTANITAKTRFVMDEVKMFRNILEQHARKGDVFQLEQHTIDVAMDVIGHFVLGTRIGNQTRRADIRTALRAQLPLTSFGIDYNPFKRLNLLNSLRRVLNARKMKAWLKPHIEAQILHQEGQHKSKTILAQALNSQLGSRRTAGKGSKEELDLDPAFRTLLTNQLRLMLFSGHDTTSSTLCYLYHTLWKHPHVLEQVRNEHDAVFGTDFASAEHKILAQPALLEALPFTQAVIQETLRLFPVVVANRQGQPNFNLVDQQGRIFPTERCLVIGVHHELQRNPSYWHSPDEFLPERWLVSPTDPMAPVRDAWRSFEGGPRVCIGRQLAMKEMKMILVMTIREFDVSSGHDEWERTNRVKGIKTVNGERAYQAYVGTAHPCDGYPCKVGFAERVQ